MFTPARVLDLNMDVKQLYIEFQRADNIVSGLLAFIGAV